MELHNGSDELIHFSLKHWEEDSVWALASPAPTAEEVIAGEEMGKRHCKKWHRKLEKRERKKTINWAKLNYEDSFFLQFLLFLQSYSLLESVEGLSVN